MPDDLRYRQLNKKQNTYLTIGQLTERVTKMTGLRCTPAMIYNYERQGLISTQKRTDGGFRLFDVDTVTRVVRIKRWQDEGLSLAEIAYWLESGLETDFEEIPDTDLPASRRIQILESALKVFPQKGFEKTTLLDVAQEAGISSATIYQYFRSKEDLFLALIDVISFRDVMESMADALKGENGIDYEDIRQVLINVGEAYLDTHTRNQEIVRMFIAESRRFPEVGKQYCQRLIAPVETLIENYFAHQIKRGIFRDVNIKLAVHAFYGMFLNFIITQDLLCGEGVLYFPKEGRVSGMVDIFLNGMLNPKPE